MISEILTRPQLRQVGLAWMALAVLVDSVDGGLARWARVKEFTPQIDGALLDNMIGYLNYVLGPALLLGWNPWTNFGVVITCAVLVFVPLKYLYPSRLHHYRFPTLFLTFLWAPW